MTILPVELIEEVVDEACRVDFSALQHVIFLSALASVCAHFRHRVNRIRFQDVSFIIASSAYPRSTERLAQLEGLINADESVWGKGDDEPSGSGLAQHIRRFAIHVGSTEDHILVVLGRDGVMTRIMRKLFRLQRETSDPSKFSLSCTVRHGTFYGSDQLMWTDLHSEFLEAFRYMCTTSSLTSLSLHGFCNVPTHVIHESVIQKLHVQAITFSKKSEEVHSRIPKILQLTSLSACLWYTKDQHMLYDILAVIPKLEKLCIYLGAKFKQEVQEPVAFNPDLPYLEELVIELEPSIDSPFSFTSPSPSPIAFILSTHTLPTVHRIEVHAATCLKNFSPRDDFMEKFRNALHLMNLPILDQQLQSSVLHTTVKHIQFVLSVILPSFPNVDTLNSTDSHQKLTGMVSSLFPLLRDSKKVEFSVSVAIDNRLALWSRRAQWNYYF